MAPMNPFQWFFSALAVFVTCSLVAASASAEPTVHRLERKTRKAVRRTVQAGAKAGVAVVKIGAVAGGVAALVLLDALASDSEDGSWSVGRTTPHTGKKNK